MDKILFSLLCQRAILCRFSSMVIQQVKSLSLWNFYEPDSRFPISLIFLFLKCIKNQLVWYCLGLNSTIACIPDIPKWMMSYFAFWMSQIVFHLYKTRAYFKIKKIISPYGKKRRAYTASNNCLPLFIFFQCSITFKTIYVLLW